MSKLAELSGSGQYFLQTALDGVPDSIFLRNGSGLDLRQGRGMCSQEW